MKKTFSLIKVNLVGFMRNWRSVLLLVVFPLVLISLIFASFNPEGLRIINGGVINEAQNFNLDEFRGYVDPFMKITEFGTVDDCIEDLKRYNQYMCVQIMGDTTYILNVHFDNTREPVIWEILQKLKTTVDTLQKEKTKSIASSFLAQFKEVINKVDSLKSELKKKNSYVDGYIADAESAIRELEITISDLDSSLDSMDIDIESLESANDQLKSEKNELINILGAVFLEPSIRNQVNGLSSKMDSQIMHIDSKIGEYETESQNSNLKIANLNTATNNVRSVKTKLTNYKAEISPLEDKITLIQNNLLTIANLDPETLVNPVVIYNKPAYIPEAGEDLAKQLEEGGFEKLVKGFNLISLQTIFPIILFLIIIFLSLLISSFISLNHINSPASDRMSLIHKISFAEVMAIYFSSFIIVIIPIFCVLILGNFLFKIAIFSNFITLMPLLFLFVSIFIFLGMGISYLIKKESITLLVSSFILISFIFFSGFILPIERMSVLLGGIASIIPGTLTLRAFNQVVFYNISFLGISHYIWSLMFYYFMLLGVVFLIKRVRKD